MTTIVEGQVLESNSTTPVAGAKVYIAREKSYTLNTRYFKLDSTISDLNGRFYLKSTSPNIDLVVYAVKEGYFKMLEDRENLTHVIPDENNRKNIYPIPYAWVRINYHQLDPSHGISINPPAGSDLLNSIVFANGNETRISRIYGNSLDDHLSTFYYEWGNLLYAEPIPIKTGSHDTTDIEISF